jgi:hypothetical protein
MNESAFHFCEDEFLQPLFFTSQSLHPRFVLLTFSVCVSILSSSEVEFKSNCKLSPDICYIFAKTSSIIMSKEYNKDLPWILMLYLQKVFSYSYFTFVCTDIFRF